MATLVNAGKVSGSGLVHLECVETFYTEDLRHGGLIFGEVIITPEANALTWLVGTGTALIESADAALDHRIAVYLRACAGHSNALATPNVPGSKSTYGPISVSCNAGTKPGSIGLVVFSPEGESFTGTCRIAADMLVQVLSAVAPLPGIATTTGDALPPPSESLTVASPIPPAVVHPRPADVDLTVLSLIPRSSHDSEA